MDYRKFGLSSLKSSVLGIGGLHFGVYCDQDRTAEIINRAIDKGINFIDTAPLYGNGNSERFIKHAISGFRKKIILSTKVGLKPKIWPDGKFGVSVEPLTEKGIRKSLEDSLMALGTDYIDLYQLHAFDPETPIEETMATIDSLVREGKIRFVGCSNYSYNELASVHKVALGHQWANLISFQVHYNLIERKAEQDIRQVCSSGDMGIICNRVLARGVLTGKYKKNKPSPPQSRAATSIRIRGLLSDENLSLVVALENFAKVRNHCLAELAISWLLSKKHISTVLVGVRNLEQFEDCLKAVDWKLSNTDLKEIDKIIEGLGLTKKVNQTPEVLFET